MQVKVCHNQKMNADQSTLVNQEIEIMLQEGVIQKMPHVSGKFLSKLFLIDKSNGEKRPVINPFIHHSSISKWRTSIYRKISCRRGITYARKYLRFKWERTLYKFLCLCFGTSPAPLTFSTLIKIPITLLWRLNICRMIYLDDMLIMTRPVQELIFHRHTVIYLLQKLGFVSQFWNHLEKYNLYL